MISNIYRIRIQLLLAAVTVAMGCAPTADIPGGETDSIALSPFLYVWAGAEEEGASDFLAVIDSDPESARYGEVLASVPVGVKGGAHHSEHVMPSGDSLFVNSFRAGKTFVIDLSDPLHPRVASSFEAIGEYSYPHTFERLPNGNVLATFQTKGQGNEVAGGLVELDPSGALVRASDAADPADPEIRAYSVTPIPRLDRAVSTTSDMNAEANGTSFQLWRLSDLTLLKTVVLEPGERGYEHRDPAEVRLLSDSVTAMMTTFTCAMYRLNGLESDQPEAELVNVLPWTSYETGACGIPATYGNIWLQTYANSTGSSLMSFDISDPSNPVFLSRLEWDEPWWPHWISIEPGGRRVVLTSSTGATRTKVLLINLDSETGEMSFDRAFRDRGSEEIGIDFDRSIWPHGAAGPAKPHGAVFSGVR
jgi:56kDa selenium binding protein (SBP56)